MSDEYPSRELDKINIRVPDGLKERVRRVAERNGRSVNTELVLLLERTYPAEATIGECVQEIASIIGKQPEADQPNAWETVFQQLEMLRDESSPKA